MRLRRLSGAIRWTFPFPADFSWIVELSVVRRRCIFPREWKGAKMEVLQNFAEWAWTRHHNPLTWYIRPLFLIPFCYAAWRRSLTGIAVALLALATSMFWFPAPARPDPRVAEFLDIEREYLLGKWGAAKFVFTAMTPVFLFALAFAFWRRSIWTGLAVIAVGSLLKIGWSLYYGGESGWTVVPPAIAGLVVIAAVMFVVRRKLGGVSH